ncbi:MAG: putative sugar O-methyltransferase [Fibromonadaceae bacterium]|jgi:hypothetical protein|nr:putative sugar O-methyltransferase [Fibromonadaceae bacterium]
MNLQQKILYGAGFWGEKAFHIYKEYVYAFVDMNKHGSTFLGKPILHPSELVALQEKYDIIICTEKYIDVIEYFKYIGVTEYQVFLQQTHSCPKNHIDTIALNCFEYHRSPYLCLDGILTEEVRGGNNNIELSERISSAYKKLFSEKYTYGDGMWFGINELKQDVHNALLSNDMKALSEIFVYPENNNLLFGFDNICKVTFDIVYTKKNFKKYITTYDYSAIIRLGEAWGAIRLDNPENKRILIEPSKYEKPQVIIRKLEELFSCKIDFPNPYNGEIGLLVGDKIVSTRAIQALHQAFTIYEKIGRNKSARILEIGAGTGRTAYFVRSLFGIKDYTIIDLPLTGVASAYFLGKTLGENAISLYGEPERPEAIRILPPDSFLENDLGMFDIILNCDSITEMDFGTMNAYWKRIKESSYSFLSVNHESNKHTLRELVANDPAVKTCSRSPYWMRQGYVEEFITF